MRELEDGEELKQLYGHRFDGDAKFRDQMWALLCREVFQRYVPFQGSVLEVAAGHCEFINNISAARRVAVDLNPATASEAAPGVEVLTMSATDIRAVQDESIDTVFVSNFFEHIDRSTILIVLREARRVLRPGGLLVVLQPNIRYCARDYWMFLDHITAIDDRALVEAFELAGLETRKVVTRFLPFTTKSRLPNSVLLLKIYLKLPLLWRILGQQSLLIAARPNQEIL